MFGFNQFRRLIKKLTALVIASFALSFFPYPSLAASDSHKQACEKFLTMVQMPAQLENMANQQLLPIRTRLSQMTTTQERVDVIRPHIKRLEQLVYDSYSWGKNKDAYIELYTNTYTEYEINTLIKFLSTGVGKKYLSPNDQFTAELTRITQTRATALQTKLKKVQDDLAAALANMNQNPSPQEAPRE